MTAPFTPEAAPAASAEPQAPGGDQGQQGTEQQQAPAGADPAVLQQMQSQMEQFGGQLGEIAQYMPAMQQLAQQNGGQQQQGEPSLEDLAAQFFGDPGYQDPAQGQPMFDPYTGEPVQQQQPRFDPYTGAPLQPQAQQQPQVGPFQGDPAELVNLFRQIANEAVAPIQQRADAAAVDTALRGVSAVQRPAGGTAHRRARRACRSAVFLLTRGGPEVRAESAVRAVCAPRIRERSAGPRRAPGRRH
jgi:hypothetical protein